MAQSLPFKEIRLSIDDVPGAKLPCSKISANSVTSLKRFLSVRGVRVPAKTRKCELEDLVENNLSKPVDPNVDGGKWLEDKSSRIRREQVNLAAATNDDFDLFPVNGWRQFPSVLIPLSFNYGQVYSHIITTRNAQEEKNSESDDTSEENIRVPDAAKPLHRGKRYFVSGHVQDLQDSYSGKSHYCLKAKVHASMNRTTYSVMVMLHSSSGYVIDASCHCKASAMARCSHVCALLIALEDYATRFGYAPPACTSSLCSWNQGRKEKSSHPIDSRQYTDVRNPARAKTCRVVNPGSAQSTIDRLKFCFELHNPTSPWGSMTSYGYAPFELSTERADVLRVLRGQLQEALKFQLEIPGAILGTELQSECSLWHSLRKIIITASSFSSFLAQGDVERKLNSLMWETQTFSNVYVKYGQENEGKARSAYSSFFGNTVQPTGLWTNPKYPGLGASPDGIVICRETQTKGLLEIKCPYLLRDHLPTDLHALSLKQRQAFCLKPDGADLRLSRTHKYFKQVQMQLGVTQFEWCDFVVWTARGIFRERIFRDDAWWATTAQTLLKFHAEYVCPEYFEVCIPRRLPPVCLPTAHD